MVYIYLLIAIIAEVIGTSALKASDGFTKSIPNVIVVIGYGLAFYFLSLVLRSIPVGVTYAIWSGVEVDERDEDGSCCCCCCCCVLVWFCDPSGSTINCPVILGAWYLQKYWNTPAWSALDVIVPFCCGAKTLSILYDPSINVNEWLSPPKSSRS